MKKIVILLLLSFSYNFISAQKTVNVSGRVKDAQTKNALQYCNVAVLNAKDSIIAGLITDEKGFFELELPGGTYYFIARYLGYATDTVETYVDGTDIFIGTIKLKPTDNELDEVNVTAQTYENKLDKDVVIVTEQLRKGAANTKDVLDRINGVSYDRYNNTIKVDNNPNVIILVNGLQKDYDYVTNLAPERIKKVEIIRDPSGRYAIEGYAAVINIILKDDYRGWELNGNMMDIFDTKSKEYPLPISRGSAGFNYTRDKVNIYSRIVRYSNNLNLFTSNTQNFEEGTQVIRSDINGMLVNNLGGRYLFGIDYYANPRHTISYEGNLKLLPDEKQATNQTLLNTYKDKAGNILYVDTSEISKISSQKGYNNTIYYVGKINSKNNITADLTYSVSQNKYDNKFSEKQMQRSENGMDIERYSKFFIQLDHIINSKLSFQMGYGNTFKYMHNAYNVDIKLNDADIPTENVEFLYTDLRNKAFAYLAYNPNDKFGIKIGSAFELSMPQAGDLKRTFFIYMPYADIKYKPIKLLDFRLKYRSSSDYPSISQTSPFEQISDNMSVSVGNPNLKPSVTHKLSLRMNVMGGLLSIEPYYWFSDNYITQTAEVRADSMVVYSYDNAGKYKNYGIEANLIIPFGKTVFWQNSVDFYKSSITYMEKTHSVDDWTMSSNLIYRNKKYSTNVMLIYQKMLSKDISGMGYRKGGNDFWMFGVQQPFFKSKLNIMIAYILPINLLANYEQVTYVETQGYQQISSVNLDLLKNMLFFNISFRFNKGKVKKNRKDIEQEQNQTKKSNSLF